MSKIGKKNIILPKDSSIKVEDSSVTITGPKGSKKLNINVKMFSSKTNEKNEFQILPLEKKIDKKTSILWGTYRSLINNAVLGVTAGHEKILEITGVIIKLHGIDKELVSKVASDIKSLKPVEPYKGKGIKEKGQFVLRKEGKKK
jgi:large subunit ribosomal protein L6